MSRADYSYFFELSEALQAEPRLIDAQPLWDFNKEEEYAAAMDRLARPLPNGQESPFSSRSPWSAHGIFTEEIVYHSSLLAYQLNLKLNRDYVQHLRSLGIEIKPAEYPIINLVFTSQTDVEIPLGVEVSSRIDPALKAIAIRDAKIQGATRSITVPARLNVLGRLPQIVAGEFTIAPNLLAIDSVTNDGSIVSEGAEQETIVEAMGRGRSEVRRGAARVSARDYYDAAIAAGATKATIYPDPYSAGFVIGVYPDVATDAVKSALVDTGSLDDPLDVRAATIIPIDGRIECLMDAALTQTQKFNAIASAISDSLNPPNGKWGDREYQTSLIAALKNVRGLYGIPSISLKHAETGQPLEAIAVGPLDLFEIQSSIDLAFV